MAVPSSQKAADRPIAFILENNGQVIASVTLVIRPEDLRRTEPALQTVTQTLAGAWLDDFGPGVANIAITGHTGWRGGFSEDGVASWLTLRDTVWTQWHVLREQAVTAGQSPDQVKLIFADALDQIVAQVAPSSFTLLRNRSSPLLMRYQMSMVVLADQLDQTTLDALGLNPDGSSTIESAVPAGIDSLSNSIDTLSTYEGTAASILPPGDAATVGGLVSTCASVFGAALALLDPIQGASTPTALGACAFGAYLATGACNALWAYNAGASLSPSGVLGVSQMASALLNVACVLGNVFGSGSSYPDYSSLEGASACSSTAGGSSLSQFLGGNPFEALVPAVTPPLLVSPEARTALASLADMDPVLTPPSSSDLAATMQAVTAGVSVA